MMMATAAVSNFLSTIHVRHFLVYSAVLVDKWRVVLVQPVGAHVPDMNLRVHLLCAKSHRHYNEDVLHKLTEYDVKKCI